MDKSSTRKISHPFFDYAVQATCMTTHIEIVAGKDKSLAQDGLRYMQRLVSTFNRFDPSSEFSKLHHNKNTWIEVSSELISLLVLSKELEQESNGFFRIDYEGLSQSPNGKHGYQVDMATRSVYLESDTQLNAGGIGKGFIADAVVDYLRSKSGDPVFVNAGGDCRMEGSYAWKIGLFNPRFPNSAFGHITLKHGAVVTSGTYVRQHSENNVEKTHFFDTKSKTYMESPPYISVTVLGKLASKSEVYAKRLLMGEKVSLPDRYKAIGVNAVTFQVETL